MERLNNLGQAKTVDEFVRGKLDKFNNMPKDFSSLFEMMFSEEENIMYEYRLGPEIAKVTYKAAKNSILKKASTLETMLYGLEANSIVGLYMDNSLDWILLFWAILITGHRPLLMNKRMDKESLESVISSLEVGAVISDKGTFSVDTYMAEDVFEGPVECENKTFGTEFFVMSSGTSAHVKVCAYTPEEVWYQINDSAVIIRQCHQIKKHYKGQLKLLTFLPFYHIFGLVAVYIWFTFFSRTLVELKDFTPRTIMETIRKHEVTHIFAVPMFWEKVYAEAVRTIEARGTEVVSRFKKGLKVARLIGDVPLLGNAFIKKAFAEVRENLFGESICFMISGGSAISKEAMEFFNNIGYRLADGYGMSEIGITSVELGSNRKILNSCSVGKPLSSFEYMINEDGELLVKGKGMAHYIIEDGNKISKRDWFNTKDLAVKKGSRFYIMGRRDDLVISPSGENMNPNIIEPLFKDTGASAVCLTAIKKDEKVSPVLIVQMPSNADDTMVKARVSECIRTANLMGDITKIIYTSEPLLGPDDFKLNRRKIAERFEKNETKEQSFKTTFGGDSGEGIKVLCELFAASTGKKADEIGIDEDFFTEIGGTSLDYLALVADIEERYNVKLPAEEGMALTTVRAFDEYLSSKSND